MSTSRLGRAEDLDKYWSEHLGDRRETSVVIESLEKRIGHSFPEVEDYPFEGQIILEGNFDFEIPGRNGESFYQSGSYQYRTASGLFLLETLTDQVDPDKVFSEINSQLSPTSQIKEALSLPRDSFWRFIEEADSIEKLILRGPDGVYDANNILQILKSTDPIQSLKTDPEFQNLRNIDNIEAALSGVVQSTRINGIQDLDIDIYETVIDEVEATYWFRNQTATLWFRRGILKLDAETAGSREYVIQLLERDVLDA